MAEQRPSFRSQMPSPLPPPRFEWPPRNARNDSSKKTLWIILGVAGGGVALLALAITVILVIAIPAASRRSANNRALNEINQQAEQMRQAALRDLESDGTFMDGSGQLDGFLKSVEETSQKLSGPERAGANAAMAVLRSMQDAVRQYETAFNEFMSSSGIAPNGLSSVEAIDKRIAIAQNLKQANGRLTDIIRGMPERFRSELLRSGAAVRDLDAAVAGFKDGARLDLLLRIRDEDVIVCDSAIALLGLLKTEWGGWDVSDDGLSIEFYNESVVPRYNQLIADLDAAAERQMSLQRQMLTQPAPRGH